MSLKYIEFGEAWSKGKWEAGRKKEVMPLLMSEADWCFSDLWRLTKMAGGVDG